MMRRFLGNTWLAIGVLAIAATVTVVFIRQGDFGQGKNTFVKLWERGQFPSGEELIQYYHECRKDRISEAAFICATEVYCVFFTNAVDRYYADDDSKTYDNDAITAEVGVVARERFDDVCRLARENDPGFIWRIQFLRKPMSSSEEMRERLYEFDSIMDYCRGKCHFAVRVYVEPPDLEMYDNSTTRMENRLRKLDPYSRACLIEMHKMILKDWRSL